MRYFAMLVMFLLGTVCLAEEPKQKETAADWSFGCRRPNVGAAEQDQPCWVQSRVVKILNEGRPNGKLYFQVHFLSARKVLRVFIERDNIRDLRPIVLKSDTEGSIAFGKMKLLDCTVRGCWGESEIDDGTIVFLASSQALGLLGSTIGSPAEEGWGFYRILTFSGFADAVEELHKHTKVKGTK